MIEPEIRCRRSLCFLSPPRSAAGAGFLLFACRGCGVGQADARAKGPAWPPGMERKRIKIFKSGAQTTAAGQTIEFSDADLIACAAAYDPATSEAPIVIGHPKTDAPAYG